MGSCFVSQLASLAKNRPSPRIRLIYLAIIDRALYHKDYSAIPLDSSLDELEKSGFEPPAIVDIIDYLRNAPYRVVAVDNTSSQAIADSYPDFLKAGISIITPNKKAFSGTYKLWNDIFSSVGPKGPFVYHESSVGAGMPIISTVNDLVETGDRITRIEGVFSGTMSFLFNSFSPVKEGGPKSSWSAEVKKAKDLGYTEPDPRDDLNGLDVARKLTILGRLAGMPIESPSAFPVQSLIPKELECASSSAEFLDRLANFDAQMDKEREEASKANKVVRFVGSIDLVAKQAKVGMEWFDRGHPIAGLEGSDNIISFYTERYGQLPLTIRGAGAGGDVTAMGVLGDLIKILRQI